MLSMEVSADVRGEALNKAITVHQLLRNIDEEESWIKEKKFRRTRRRRRWVDGTLEPILQGLSAPTEPCTTKTTAAPSTTTTTANPSTTTTTKPQVEMPPDAASAALFLLLVVGVYCLYSSAVLTFCGSTLVLKKRGWSGKAHQFWQSPRKEHRHAHGTVAGAFDSVQIIF
ncbi:hypothetical protein niasHT_019090 [Heterodera trifolii]|uniref:Uncharacterized protein n=1 Tax=Heterodera trifolii TaxID=157864 RepID=A0ABD2LAV3_9BILA